MIDKQKLIKWIEEEIGILSGPYDENETPEDIARYKARINTLRRLDMHIRAGNLDVEEVAHEQQHDLHGMQSIDRG